MVHIPRGCLRFRGRDARCRTRSCSCLHVTSQPRPYSDIELSDRWKRTSPVRAFGADHRPIHQDDRQRLDPLGAERPITNLLTFSRAGCKGQRCVCMRLFSWCLRSSHLRWSRFPQRQPFHQTRSPVLGQPVRFGFKSAKDFPLGRKGLALTGKNSLIPFAARCSFRLFQPTPGPTTAWKSCS